MSEENHPSPMDNDDTPENGTSEGVSADSTTAERQLATNGHSAALDEDLEGAESAERDPEMYSMMVNGMYELDQALQESGKLLQAKEKELIDVRDERNRLKESMAREIMRKTELSSLLEESRQHAIALEGLIEKWQEEVRHVKQKEETTRAQLTEHANQLVKARQETAEARAECAATAQENTTLKKRVAELEQQLRNGERKQKGSSSGSEPATDLDYNWAFLKTSVYHFFTDLHAYEQAKAIVSILNFDAQERKKIYAKLDEKYGRRTYSASH